MPTRWEGRITFDPKVWLGKRYYKVGLAWEKVLEEAVENAKRFTAQRPSAKSGKAGRVDTEAMINAITSVYRFEVDKIVGEFGFMNQAQLYYVLQTQTGFTHWLSGEFIEPTFAIRDATIIAENRLRDELKKAFNRRD